MDPLHTNTANITNVISDPGPLSDSVVLSDQLLRETSGADVNEIGLEGVPPVNSTVATDWIVGPSPKMDRGFATSDKLEGEAICLSDATVHRHPSPPLLLSQRPS